MNDAQISHMVSRFLAWKLPESFRPDAGISFEPEYNAEWNAQEGRPPSRHEPSGTNLLDATQARAMVLHMLDGLPSPQPNPPHYRPKGQTMSETREIGWLCEWNLRNGPEWWSLEDAQGEGGYFTKDSTKALRFARKQDAEAYINDAGWTEIVATEHQWG